MSYGHGTIVAQLARLGACHDCPAPATGLIIDGRRYCPTHGLAAFTAQETAA